MYDSKTAISHLKGLHLANSKVKHPELPYHTTPLFSASSSNGLTKCIKHFLTLKGHFCERTGNEGRVIDNRETFIDTVGITRTIGNIKRVKSSGTPGTSDLKSCINGRFIAIEIKFSKDRIRSEQVEYRKQVESAGAIYFIATTLHDFLNWYYKTFANG